ncbi:hypothetical protein CERSUDRAFT_89502 [Gelatoporia subvermispora B]|uniref:Carbonic anhydrase n=1 Tax=Ceriporiopsis subvermispora (strain B) TaxID=914234 RepID=M2QGD7_CERS8|nr:hypothetical protein CERSUDRAFT_89502 [Gelatoporia subvermispora B]
MLSDHVLPQLLAQNKQWAAEVEKNDPGFFERSATGQHPKVLWIGCSDSRVPESVITASMPGAIFTHRNIANQCHLNDDNALSVLEYAVGTVEVPHIIVVGHTHCGGVAHAWATAHGVIPHEHFANWGDHIPRALSSETPLSRWLEPLTEIARAKPALTPEQLGVANVHAQVINVVRSKAVQQAWAQGRDVWVHGWEYDLATGSLQDLHLTTGRETFGGSCDAA